MENRPPLFSKKSLVVTVKIITFFTAFYTATIVFKLLSDPAADNPLVPQNVYAPLYFLAIVHVILLLIQIAMILTKKYNWIIAFISAIIIIVSRFYYSQIADWVWTWWN